MHNSLGYDQRRKAEGAAESGRGTGGAAGGQHERLEGLARQLDWMRLGEIYAAREGRPAYPPLLMFKALLLQQWYTWSDPELEAALADRLSFRRLVGLALDQHAPDHATLSRFRAQLAPRTGRGSSRQSTRS